MNMKRVILGGLLAGLVINIGEDGACRDCRKHVTGGEFDWILSRIETPGASGGSQP